MKFKHKQSGEIMEAGEHLSVFAVLKESPSWVVVKEPSEKVPDKPTAPKKEK